MAGTITLGVRATLAAAIMTTAAACQSVTLGGPPPITYRNAQTLAPELLQDKLIAQLDALLITMPPPPRWRRSVGPDRFYNTWMATRPRLNEADRLCTYDLLQVDLQPELPPGRDLDEYTPAHAVGLETSKWFAPLPAGATDCTGRDPARAHYFEADNWIDAGRDYSMLKDVLARLHTAAPGFAITCDEEQLCREKPGEAIAETLWDISACRGVPLPTGGDCRHYSWREPEWVEMDITFTVPRLDRQVVTVNFEPSVIVN